MGERLSQTGESRIAEYPAFSQRGRSVADKPSPGYNILRRGACHDDDAGTCIRRGRQAVGGRAGSTRIPVAGRTRRLGRFRPRNHGVHRQTCAVGTGSAGGTSRWAHRGTRPGSAMNSRTTRRFRELFSELPVHVQRQAREAYRLFTRSGPSGPSFLDSGASGIASPSADGSPELCRETD